MMRRTQTRRRHLCALVGRHSGRSCALPSISSPSSRGGRTSQLGVPGALSGKVWGPVVSAVAGHGRRADPTDLRDLFTE
eukprot:COSAG01_NODE_1055_length_11904_cov_16.177213_5_plen_79_part_00